jgi:hypothetical protein
MDLKEIRSKLLERRAQLESELSEIDSMLGLSSVEEAIKNNPGSSIDDIASLTGRDKQELYREIPNLAEKGAVYKKGRGWYPTNNPKRDGWVRYETDDAPYYELQVKFHGLYKGENYSWIIAEIGENEVMVTSIYGDGGTLIYHGDHAGNAAS